MKKLHKPMNETNKYVNPSWLRWHLYLDMLPCKSSTTKLKFVSTVVSCSPSISSYEYSRRVELLK